MSSDSDEENVIRYGTPLEPYEEDEIPSKRKFQQPADQYAVDAHGRRRFHGAFTGGFSAGFQNTVGSVEGWKPATFKSSRTERAQTSGQRAEDYMDEEDRSEFGIAPRHMQTHSEFSGQKRPRQKQFHTGPIPGEPVLEQLVRAVHETAAMRMLKSMGWRPGQGAGERVSRGEKRQAVAQHKVYGCYMPEGIRQAQQTHSEDSDSDSEYDFDTLFAPDDYEPYILAKKTDRFGLGYSGLSRHSVLGSLAGEYSGEPTTSHLVMKDKGRKVSIRGQAFGVGAFEADDEDIYASEDMSHYDFTIGPPTPKENKPQTSKKEANVLEGFVAASKPLPPVPSYPPPALPRGYTPAPAGARRSRFEPTTAVQRDQGLGRHELTPQARGALLGEELPKPIPETRIHIQENTPTQTQENPSMYTSNQTNQGDPITKPKENPPIHSSNQTNQGDHIAKPKEDVIAKLLGRNVNFVTTNASEQKELEYISIKDSGKKLTKTFKPFANNPQKQLRYEKFLSDKGEYMRERDGVIDKVIEWERNRELIEFEQAAKLYRPLTGEMGDRFTHASEPDDGALNPFTAVAKSRNNYGLATPEQIAAAEKGVYGVMTRTSVNWRPEALVCKRFNVPQPGGTIVEPPKEDRPKLSYSIFSYLENSVHDKESFAKEQSKFSGSKSLNTDNTPKKVTPTENKEKTTVTPKEQELKSSTSEYTGFTKRLTVAELFMKEAERDLKKKKEGQEVSDTIEKFDKMDLYKSIFLSDSEEETEKTEEDQNTKINFDDFVDVPKNTERNTSPPRGIFANVNFDELNSWKRNANQSKEMDGTTSNQPKERDSMIINQPKEKGSTTNNNNEKSKELLQSEDLYGPKIPENLQKRLEGTAPIEENFRPIFRSKTTKEEVHEISSSSSDSWVDAEAVKKKKSKKKKSKKHKHKKTSKHKKKDR